MIEAKTEVTIPSDIVQKLRSGRCILFLGAKASVEAPEDGRYRYTKEHAPPDGATLCEALAKKCGYEYPDRTLQRVALYFEYHKDEKHRGSRAALVQAIRDEITRPGIVESPALQMLAALPFPIIITTNYDNLFDRALAGAKTRDGRPKFPITKVYDPDPRKAAEFVPLDPEEARPILLKLHGDINDPASIVITEEDYIIFVQKMSSTHWHPIHQNIRTRMTTWPVLFIGYSLKDYNLRLLFRALRLDLDPSTLDASFSVDPYPDELILAVYQDEKRMISFVQQSLWDFVPALYAGVMQREF